MFINLSRPGFWARQDMPDDGDEWIGYDRMVQIVKEHNERQAREKQNVQSFEAGLEKAYWEYDSTRKSESRSDRDWFKRAIRMHIDLQDCEEQDAGPEGSIRALLRRALHLEEGCGDFRIVATAHACRARAITAEARVCELEILERRKAFTNPALGVPLSVEEWANKPVDPSPTLAGEVARLFKKNQALRKSLGDVEIGMQGLGELVASIVGRLEKLEALAFKPHLVMKANVEDAQAAIARIVPNITPDLTGEGSAYMGEPTPRVPSEPVVPVGWLTMDCGHSSQARVWQDEKWIPYLEWDHKSDGPWIMPDPSFPWGEGYEVILPNEADVGDTWLHLATGRWCSYEAFMGVPYGRDSLAWRRLKLARLPGAAGLAEKVQEIQAGAAKAPQTDFPNQAYTSIETRELEALRKIHANVQIVPGHLFSPTTRDAVGFLSFDEVLEAMGVISSIRAQAGAA